jgi:glycosyltransferase involved in cell wall biosynthesis
MAKTPGKGTQTTTPERGLVVPKGEEPQERNGAHASEREEILKASRRHKPIVDPATPAPAAPAPAAPPQDTRPVLALLCYEGPDTPVGRYVAGLVALLARRQHTAVHLFTRTEFPQSAPGVAVHPVGETEGDLLAQVHEFTERASGAFLKQFEASPARVTLMGCEWSTVGALSRLRGLRRIETLLSLHSLERQRSDMRGELSQRIEEIERTGLREAKAVLVHDARAEAAARACLPDCADRLAVVPQLIEPAPFNTGVDAGVIKARYQIGPIDPTVLYVGDLSERYGPDLLVKALPSLMRNQKQMRLIVAGDGALLWPLKVYARYLLIEHAVRFPGSVEGMNMCELMQAADVVVVPSREATPWWPVLAAWAAKRPLVATHNAAPGLIQHEHDGVLCYPSENSLVWGVERVLNDEKLRATMAKNASAKLEERFGWANLATQVEELLGVQQAH